MGRQFRQNALCDSARMSLKGSDLALWESLFEHAWQAREPEAGLRALNVLAERGRFGWFLALRRFELKLRLGESTSAVLEALPFATRFFREGHVEHFALCVDMLAQTGSSQEMLSILLMNEFDSGFYDDFVATAIEAGRVDDV